MKQFAKLILLLSVKLILVPFTCYAGNFYAFFGVNAGYQSFDMSDNESYHNSGVGYNYRIGYWFDNNIGADIGYSGIILGDSLRSENGGTAADRARTNEYSARLSYRFISNIYCFLGGGLSATQIGSDWFYGPAFTGGIGLKIPLDDHWSVGGEFSYSYHNVFSEQSNDFEEPTINRLTGALMIGYAF